MEIAVFFFLIIESTRIYDWKVREVDLVCIMFDKKKTKSVMSFLQGLTGIHRETIIHFFCGISVLAANNSVNLEAAPFLEPVLL